MFATLPEWVEKGVRVEYKEGTHEIIGWHVTGDRVSDWYALDLRGVLSHAITRGVSLGEVKRVK